MLEERIELELDRIKEKRSYKANKLFNTNPGGYIKRTSLGGSQFISTLIFKERGCRKCVDLFL